MKKKNSESVFGEYLGIEHNTISYCSRIQRRSPKKSSDLKSYKLLTF